MSEWAARCRDCGLARVVFVSGLFRSEHRRCRFCGNHNCDIRRIG
jgi:hypothetical protein